MNNEIVLYEAVSVGKELPENKWWCYFTYHEVEFKGKKMPQSLGAQMWDSKKNEFEMEDEYSAQPTHWLRPIPNHVAVSLERLEALEKCAKVLEDFIISGRLHGNRPLLKIADETLSNLSTIK